MEVLMGKSSINGSWLPWLCYSQALVTEMGASGMPRLDGDWMCFFDMDRLYIYKYIDI